MSINPNNNTFYSYFYHQQSVHLCFGKTVYGHGLINIS